MGIKQPRLLQGNTTNYHRRVLRLVLIVPVLISNKIWSSRLLVFLGFVLISLLTYSKPINMSPAEISSTNTLLANPAAVYCQDLGYEYKIVNEVSGQSGICLLPGRETCDAWQFLQGKCGQDYSYCSQQGYQIRTVMDGNDPFSIEYAVCISNDGQEIGTVTELSGLEEKARMHGCGLEEIESIPTHLEIRSTENDSILEQGPILQVPSSYDWRNYQDQDWMTPIKNQGSCGSCWAFSAVGVAEAAHNIGQNDPDLDMDLSEQYLVSDCLSDSTCCGGWPNVALEYIRDSGIPDESCMPYVDVSGCTCGVSVCDSNCDYNTGGNCSDNTCSDRCIDWSSRLVQIDRTGYVSSNPETIKQNLIDVGPLSVTIAMTGFWDGDIYRCGDDPINHAVSIVGYDDAGDYWIIRNSWGGTWNGDGYFKLGYGECRVEQDVYYAQAGEILPLPFSKSNPPNASIDQPTNPILGWERSEGAEGYEYCIDTINNDLCDESWIDVGSNNHVGISGLTSGTVNFWQVRARNENGAIEADAGTWWSFTATSEATILLVDDDDNDPDVRYFYSDVLDAIGVTYNIWDTFNSDNEPNTSVLDSHSVVVWFSGDEYGGAAGPGAAGEVALASFLDDGNCFFISSQDYYYDRGLTSFMQNYFGVSSVVGDTGQTTVTGSGSVFSGLGPYTLSYPSTNYSDNIAPDASAELAFNGDVGDAAVNKDSGIYRTTFLGFPFEAIPDLGDREDVLYRFLMWCDSAQPDLHPYAPPGYPYPVVPSSVPGTHEVDTLYAGQDTYFDWHFINSGIGTAEGSFHVELWVGDTRYIRYPYSDYGAGWSGGFDDWAETIPDPGWHTVKLITDPDDTIAETDEDNNVWEQDFYWEPFTQASITVNPTSGLVTSEGGGTETFTVVLDSQPSANVSIGLSSSDTSEGTVSPSSLTFTSANWDSAQTVTVTGVDDAVDDGGMAYMIITAPATSADSNYTGLNPANVSVTNVDDDDPGIIVTPASDLVTTEAGGTDTFTVVLDSQPSANVSIGLSSSNTSEGTVSPSLLTFTSANWDTAQTVTVTGVDDAVDDDDMVYTIITALASSSDSDYNGLNAADVSVTNIDDDGIGITVAPISGLVTTEADGTDTFTVELASQPTANVSIGLSSSDTSEGTVSPSSLTFTSANWDTAQTVTVTGVDDAIDDGDIAYTIITAPASSSDPDYNGMNCANVSGTNIDDDGIGITVAPISWWVTTEAGGTDTFTVVLDSQPSANVSIGLSSSDTSEGTVSPSLLTFTSANWDTAQTVTVTGVDDAVDDGDMIYTIITSPASSSDPDYDGEDAIDISVTNVDDDLVDITVSPISGLVTTEADGTDTFTVVLDSQPTANVSIGLSSTDTSEGTVSPTSLTFTTANWDTAQTVTVTGVDDPVDDGNQTYTIITAPASSSDPDYNGLNAADVSVTNNDDDNYGITVVPTSGLVTTEAGGTDTFTVVLDSQPTANVSIGLSSTNTSEGTVSPTSLTFTSANWDSEQTVTVTGVDDAIDDGDIAYTIITAPASSSDPDYSGLNADDTLVTNINDDEALTIIYLPLVNNE